MLGLSQSTQIQVKPKQNYILEIKEQIVHSDGPGAQIKTLKKPFNTDNLDCFNNRFGSDYFYFVF